MHKNTKQDLLNNLTYDTYCRIGVSKIQGVGVIAVKDIPPGVNPFMITNKECVLYKTFNIKEVELKDVPKPVTELVKAYFVPDELGQYTIPENGLNSLDISFYLNHSKNNNLDLIQTNCEYTEFISNKLIKAGEELTINYKNYG